MYNFGTEFGLGEVIGCSLNVLKGKAKLVPHYGSRPSIPCTVSGNVSAVIMHVRDCVQVTCASHGDLVTGTSHW